MRSGPVCLTGLSLKCGGEHLLVGAPRAAGSGNALIARDAAVALMSGDNSDRIARIGGRESYSDKAAREFFGESAKILKRESFHECFLAVLNGEAGGALVPVYNAITKDVRMDGKAVKEMASDMGLYVASRHRLKVRLVLASYGILDEIKIAYSIQPALDQCTDFFERHKDIARASTINNKRITDTSMAAECIKNLDVLYAGAICDADAAAHHGVPVALARIANKKDNYTDFFLYRK